MSFNGPRAALQRKGFWKRKPPGPTAKARKRRRGRSSSAERTHKETVRDRDVHCRFPRCGCQTDFKWLNLGKCTPTVSHDKHKGMGGNPADDRSTPDLMILFCKWRHQDGFVSRHAGTLRTRYLTTDNNDGPVAFDVDLAALYPGRYDYGAKVWFEAAVEIERGVLGPLTEEQVMVLDELAEMIR